MTTELLDAAPAAAIAPPLGVRDLLTGVYPKADLGKRAIDGATLDEVVGDHAISRSWRAECGFCFRPEKASMVPTWLFGFCPQHGRQDRRVIAAVSAYPMDAEELAAADARAWSPLAAKYGVPSIYRSVAFETSLNTPAVIAARAYCAIDTEEYLSRAVVLEGGVGTGKTWAEICALRYLAVRAFDDVIVFHPFGKLVTALLDQEQRDEVLETASKADELIIDDAGSSYLKRDGMAAGLIEELIIERESHERPLLMSTNLAPKAFREMFGDRVYDRLRGTWGAWVRCAGPSLRGKRKGGLA
jgi:hypothetical protein